MKGGGNFGIGTSTPVSKLDIAMNDGNIYTTESNASNGHKFVGLAIDSDNDEGSRSNLFFRHEGITFGSILSSYSQVN